MNDKVTHFPQYRMLSNGKSYYKITDDRNFEEIQRMGSRLIHHVFTAEQYPEILKIRDMLECYEAIYTIVSDTEWEMLMENVK